MGLLASLKGDRVYLDANIWIYISEEVSAYSDSLAALSEAVELGKLKLVTSELSLAEILVRPIREENTLEQDVYKDTIVNDDSLTVVPVVRDILILAAGIRATTKLKLPDAIHAASAIATQCTTFLTNDKQFQTLSDLHVVLLSQASEEDSDS